MKSGTFTNNTSFSATAASIQIPAGGKNVTVDYGNNEQILIPNNVTVVSVDGNYVGVTPNKKYTLVGWTPFVHHTGDELLAHTGRLQKWRRKRENVTLTILRICITRLTCFIVTSLTS